MKGRRAPGPSGDPGGADSGSRRNPRAGPPAPASLWADLTDGHDRSPDARRESRAASLSSPLLAETNRMRDNQATLPIQHGGNQSAIRARLRLGNRPLLDFSAPLNGLGPPAGAVTAVRRSTDSIGRYPEPGSPRLVERLAEFHGVPADRILVGAGHQRADQPGRPGRPRRPARATRATPATPTGPSPTWSSRPTASTAGRPRRTASAPRSGTATPWAGTWTSTPGAPTGSSGPVTRITPPAAPGTGAACST